ALVDKLGPGPLRDAEWRAALARNPWRGNVRELRNYLESSLIAPVEPEIGAGYEAPPDLTTTLPLAQVRDSWVRYVERRYLRELLELHGGNVSAAARAAGIDRAHFYRIMAACGLR